MTPSKRSKKAPMAAGVDRIGALPDEILHHLLSFLPAEEAVRTCVLARRWRHVWKFTTGLRIVESEDFPRSIQDVRDFVDYLLILRGHEPLNTFEVELSDLSQDDAPYLNLWARFALLCKVRELTLCLYHTDYLCAKLDGLPIVSRNLTTLNLRGVGLQGGFLDFSRCPALEDLRMRHCQIDVDKISSLSLKRLSIVFCRSALDHRVTVSAPRLVSFTLDSFAGRTPLLEIMPMLESALVELGRACTDFCHNYRSRGFCAANSAARCANCLAYNDESSNTVLLGAIYNAEHLQLISPLGMMIFARDLKSCPTFNKLKTLLLNSYWCVGPDFDALTCILKHSPVLEKLTLQLVSEEEVHKVEMKGSYSSTEKPTGISEHLKLVSVKYNVVDDRVLQLLKFMCTFNIRFSFE
ncbi:F-box protein At5g03100 [Lolium perenne]|uniref:F-box protein At5g03100 n=1 Tax=Lolium perenne TaxID=4522 RepID=UPI003A98F1C6